jgi:hypothetical protein
VLNELVGSADIDKPTEANLSYNGAELAARSGDTMAGRAITCGKNFARNEEGGGVGAEVLEEIGETIQNDEALR